MKLIIMDVNREDLPRFLDHILKSKDTSKLSLAEFEAMSPEERLNLFGNQN